MEKIHKTKNSILRQKAEKLLNKKITHSEIQLSESDSLKLIHELLVHQIELELQNDELILANKKAIGITAENELQYPVKEYDSTIIEKKEMSRVQLLHILESSLNEIYVFDSVSLLFDYVNLGALRNLGYSLKAMRTMTPVDLKPEFTEESFRETIAPLLVHEQSQLSFNTVHCRADGSLYPVDVHLQLVEHEGKIVFLALIMDITESKQTDEKLRENNLRLELAMQAANLAWWEMDIATGNVTFGKRKAEMLGFPPEKFQHYKDFMSLVHPEDQERTMNAMRRHLDGTIDKYEIEYRILTQSNGYKWFYDVGSVVKSDTNGKPLIFTGLVVDISDRKQTELALHNSETHLRTLVQNIPDLIWLKDPNGKYLSCNPMFERLFGAKEAGLVGKTDYDFVDRKLADFFRENDRKAIEAGKPTSNEEWVTFADDGHRAYLETIKTPMYDSGGKLIGILGIGRDITERKQSEETLRESEARFRAIFDQAPIAMALIDLQGHPIISNAPLSKMLGYSTDELAEMKFTEFTYPEDVDKDLIQFTDLLAGKISGYSMEKRYLHKNGTLIWANLFVTILNDNSGLKQEIIGMVEDITERKKAEKEITMLAHSLKSINECVSITDLDNKIIFVNESFLKTYEYDLNELIGTNISIVSSQANEQTKVDEILPATILGGWQGELLNRRKDGSEFPIYLSTTVINDKENRILGLIGVATDISERKHAEMELLEAKNKAEESDLLKSSFLANMSHEVRTPLNSIIGFSELLADPDFEEDQKNEFIGHIITSGNNLLNIISDIMDISKLESGEIKIRNKKINAHDYISTIEGQFARQVNEKNLELIHTHPLNSEETVIFADPDRLRQIFNNLMSNAIKFTANGSIEIGYQPKGKMVEFCIKDTGIGIPEEYQKKIFERFRQVDDQANRQFGGNGLGLAISKNLVELMGGKIWFVSEPGVGSEFHFTMPTYCLQE